MPPRVLALPGGDPVLHYGSADGPQLVILQPLFEEMNRCRALVAALCRGLAARGIGCWLPDLPGTGESVRALIDVTWADWTAAVAATVELVEAKTGVAPASVAIRGGALLDHGFAARWRLSPVAGASLSTDLRRAGLTGAANAGYALSDDLAAALSTAKPRGEARTLRLAGDDRPCDDRIEGPALWRRSEPAGDTALVTALVDEITAWSPPREREATSSSPNVREKGESDGPSPPRGRRIIWRDDVAITLDGPAEATVGWVLVTGGTQTRVGPHRLYERLAAMLADRGEAVVRFDRPGVGDSAGDDPGFDDGTAIATASAALRRAFPRLHTVSGFGLCDGATTLALHGRAAGIGRLVLANPWAVEPTDALPPAAAIRGHYRDRLRDPRAWARLLRGGVDLRKLARGLVRSTATAPSPLAERIAAGVPAETRVVLATGDNTARAFEASWRALPAPPAIETVAVASASHSFADPAAFDALAAALR